MPIWHVTASKSAAKIMYPIDLLAAVLDGSVAPATQVRDDGAASWIAAADHPRIAPLLSRRDQMRGGRWLFVALGAPIGAVLLVPLLGSGFHGWTKTVTPEYHDMDRAHACALWPATAAAIRGEVVLLLAHAPAALLAIASHMA